MSDKVQFQRIAIIGLGLIGSSLAHAARAQGLAVHIAGHDADIGIRARADAISLVDSMHSDIGDAVMDADLVIVATPVGACEAVAMAINCLLYTSPSPRDLSTSRMPSSA